VKEREDGKTVNERRLKLRTKLPALVAAVLLALVLADSALATTAPGSNVVIYVDYTKTGMTVSFQGTAPRGVIASFDVINHGNKPHTFSLLGKTTKVVDPGRRALLTISLLRRGTFLYESTLDRGNKHFRGYFVVY
jgi:hypothetical protein